MYLVYTRQMFGGLFCHTLFTGVMQKSLSRLAVCGSFDHHRLSRVIHLSGTSLTLISVTKALVGQVFCSYSGESLVLSKVESICEASFTRIKAKSDRGCVNRPADMRWSRSPGEYAEGQESFQERAEPYKTIIYCSA